MHENARNLIDDGDQVTIKLLWSQEANAECDRVMKSKSFYISSNGENVRKIKYEVYQTFYDMTREPYEDSRHVPEEFKQELLKRDPKDFDFTFLSDLFGNKKVTNKNGKSVIKKSPYECTDIITLKANEYHNKRACETTIGRLCWNKIMIDRIGMFRFFEYNNDVLIKKKGVAYEEAMTKLLIEDKITTTEFRKYIDHRDWLGLQLHGIITVSLTEKTVKTPLSVKRLRDKLFKQYEKELADGDILVANKIEKELIDAMVAIIKDDPGFDLYNSGARGDINNHMKNIFLMRGAVKNPNTGKYDVMKTSFNEGLRKEDFTPASNSVVQGAYFKSCATADSGYLAKQLMAGNQGEVVDEDGTDCGTHATLDFILQPDDVNDFSRRYIDDNGETVLLTSENAHKYTGRMIHLYSPMCCKGTKSGKICSKCAGILDSKFVGLDTNKIATTLTNLNMKKFHDSTLRFQKLDMNDLLVSHDTSIFKLVGNDIVVNASQFEMYVPEIYFRNNLMAENLPTELNLFGIVSVGIYKDGKFDHYDTLKIPSWHTYMTYETDDQMVELPGLGPTHCRIYRYLKGHNFCKAEVLEDSANAQLMLRFVNYGKIPSTVPYQESIWLWRKNQKLNKVDFGVPSTIQEVVLSSAYRWKKNPAYKFAKIIGKNPNHDPFDYEMASIRRICQVSSTFSGMTFEAFDDTVSMAINRSRNNAPDAYSPLEDLLKL